LKSGDKSIQPVVNRNNIIDVHTRFVNRYMNEDISKSKKNVTDSGYVVRKKSIYTAIFYTLFTKAAAAAAAAAAKAAAKAYKGNIFIQS
jgi:hypothetical protein